MRRSASTYTDRQKITVVVVFILFLGTMVSLVRNLMSFWGLDTRIVSLEQEVGSLRQENQNLQGVADALEKGERDEEEIRNTLGLVKPGETVVIIPDEMIKVTEEPEKLSPREPEELPIWQQWLDIFK